MTMLWNSGSSQVACKHQGFINQQHINQQHINQQH